MINEFIELHKREILAKKESIKNWKQNNPEAPHEYDILNSAWVKGEENILNKLEEWVKEKSK